jgi:hypothetical protein
MLQALLRISDPCARRTPCLLPDDHAHEREQCEQERNRRNSIFPILPQRSLPAVYFGAAAALLAADGAGGAPNCSSRMSCIAVCVERVGSRNVSAPADCIIPLTR